MFVLHSVLSCLCVTGWMFRVHCFLMGKRAPSLHARCWDVSNVFAWRALILHTHWIIWSTGTKNDRFISPSAQGGILEVWHVYFISSDITLIKKKSHKLCSLMYHNCTDRDGHVGSQKLESVHLHNVSKVMVDFLLNKFFAAILLLSSCCIKLEV